MTDKYKGQATVPVDPQKLLKAMDSMRRPSRTQTKYRAKSKRGWSQYDLAIESGVSRSYISEILIGRKQPRALVAKALADALEVDVNELV